MNQTKDDRRSYKKAYDAAHREKNAAYMKAYNATHKEESRAWHKAHYATHREEALAYMRTYSATHRLEQRDRVLRSKYGISLEDYGRTLADQGDRCKICGTDKPGWGKTFFVDHDHKTGRVRGLLCDACNKLIGFSREDRTILASADLYLRG